VIPPPRVSGVALRPAAFPAAGNGGSIASAAHRSTGTTVSYRDSLAATTTFTVLRLLPGIIKGRNCVRQRRSTHHAKRCMRYIPIGAFTHTDRAGANSFHFSGRVGGHPLAHGSYRLSAIPRVGRTSGPATSAAFRITT
jgi:hypothetical protein